MKIIPAFIFVFALNVSYSQEHFIGKAFKLTTDFDEENCQGLGRCDCCSADLIFVANNLFYYIPTCQGSTYYYRGNYVVTKDSLTLYFDPIEVVNAYNWEAEVDENAEKFLLTSERKEMGSSLIAIESCNEKLLIRTITDKTPELGLENTNWSTSKLIELEQSEPMKVLLNR